MSDHADTLRIDRIEVFEVELPFPAPFIWSGGRLDGYTSTIVRVRCNEGVDGWGETCPFGSHYLAGYHGGVLPGLKELAPALIGQTPLGSDRVNSLMDRRLNGHEYVKSAIDIACWDIAGKVSGMPVCDLLGGRFDEPSRCISGVTLMSVAELKEAIEARREQGVEVLSFKISSSARTNIPLLEAAADTQRPDEDFLADANRAMTTAEALRMLRALPSADFMYEQLCPTYEEFLSVRRQTHHPLVLDEPIVTTTDILRAVADRAGDALNLKIGRVGGLTKAKRIRDICIAAGMRISVQDTGGSDITGASLTHFAQSIPAANRHSVWNAKDLKQIDIFENDIVQLRGKLEAGTAPGLGLTPIPDVLGEPVEVFEA